MCLLCNEVNAVAKEYNLRRHYTTTHETFDANYPPGSDLRKERIKKLAENYNKNRRNFTRAFTVQERGTAASLRVACESSFSHMNAIKTSNRASLTNEHLHHCLRVAHTSYEPSFSAIAQSKKCNLSH